MWRYIFSLFLVINGVCLSAQEAPVKQKDPVNLKPYELKVGINAIRSSRTFFGSDLITHEIETALGIHKYHLVVDYGIEEHERGDSLDYQNRGSYFRVGFDRNFSKDKKSGNALTLG